MPRELNVQLIQRDAFRRLADMVTTHSIDMSVDDLSKLSSIVLEHFLEASAQAAPNDLIGCPSCGSHSVNAIEELAQTKLSCKSCQSTWWKKKPEVELEDKTDGLGVYPAGFCPNCKRDNVYKPRPCEAQCHSCGYHWATKN